MFIRRYIWMLLSLCLLTGCSFRSLHETLSVVGEADSLWQQGQMCDDSVRLAQAYSTLRVWRTFYSDAYAHACYHYGKLLRANDDPVAAMQVFIDATHSRTRDYHILGRVYNNMGDICHRAGDYELSYDMFERSANEYLADDDTLSYYYCLNDMALEKAVQGKKDSSFALLHLTYETKFNDSLLIAYGLLVQAEVYLRDAQYDSTILCAHTSKLYNPHLLQTSMQLAQAYSYLEIRDSATYYANLILQQSQNKSDIHNALFILTNDDDTKSIEAVRQLAADRADVQKILKIRQGKLSQAVQLLKQDLVRKPNMTWLYAVCLTILLIGTCLYLYVTRKHRHHKLLSQQIYELERKSNETIAQKRLQVEFNCALYAGSNDLRKDLFWSDYDKMCHIVDQQFYMLASKLRQKQVLTEKELRLCVLVLLDMNRKKISDILPYALNSIGKLKDHTAKLLGTTGKNLRDHLIKLAINS